MTQRHILWSNLQNTEYILYDNIISFLAIKACNVYTSKYYNKALLKYTALRTL